jgi:octaprenyl-diphosphate synthase
MTLPLIHVLNTCTAKEKSWLINSIKTIIRTRGVLKKCLCKDNDGLLYAESKMVEFQQEALCY